MAPPEEMGKWAQEQELGFGGAAMEKRLNSRCIANSETAVLISVGTGRRESQGSHKPTTEENCS